VMALCETSCNLLNLGTAGPGESRLRIAFLRKIPPPEEYACWKFPSIRLSRVCFE
jgi:hypothetical protein